VLLIYYNRFKAPDFEWFDSYEQAILFLQEHIIATEKIIELIEITEYKSLI
jgi:hypothetical protein